MLFGSTVSRVLPRPVVGAVNRLLHLEKLQQLYDDAVTGSGFFRELLAELQIKVNVAERDLTNIPQTGSVIAVSNHPFGMLDGAILGNLLMSVRSDVRILTNRLLSELGELRKVCIFIDPFDDPKNRAANARAMRDSLKHLKQGGLLLVFPAGEVSYFDWSHGEVRDPAWRVTAARLARASGAPVLPILFVVRTAYPFICLAWYIRGCEQRHCRESY